MDVLHGTWIPAAPGDFAREGDFCLWAETLPGATPGPTERHPFARDAAALADLLTPAWPDAARARTTTIALVLPGRAGTPLPSLDLARYLETDLDDAATPGVFTTEALVLANPGRALDALYQACLERPHELLLGSDLQFWRHVCHALRGMVARDQYVPGLKLQEVTSGKGRAQRTELEIWPHWLPLSPRLAEELDHLAARMPLACRTGLAVTPAGLPAPQAWEARGLLDHFAEVALDRAVGATPWPKSFTSRLAGTWLASLLPGEDAALASCDLDAYQAWRAWADRLRGTAGGDDAVDLAFQLEAPDTDDGAWRLVFLAVSRRDPSLQIALGDYWGLATAARTKRARALITSTLPDPLLTGATKSSALRTSGSCRPCPRAEDPCERPSRRRSCPACPAPLSAGSWQAPQQSPRRRAPP